MLPFFFSENRPDFAEKVAIFGMCHRGSRRLFENIRKYLLIFHKLQFCMNRGVSEILKSKSKPGG